MILSSLYNGPLIYFAHLIHDADNIIIERHDHYAKQTYRNRCTIMGANGLIDLSIPVVHQHGGKTQMKDIRIDYDTRWMHNHWRSITSAYASAPFFEFTSEYFSPHYLKEHYNFLLDLNTGLLESAMEAMNIPLSIGFTKSFKAVGESDPREYIHPKRRFESKEFLVRQIAYHQVFGEKFGFQFNLSILDLIFNTGPDAPLVLKKMLIKKPGEHLNGLQPGHPDS